METNDSLNRVYEPTLESVKQHQVPPWFHDAKFGIFIHWSLSSIPAFAPAGSPDIVEIIKTGGWKAQYKNNPYAEWYLNSLKIKGSPVRKYHAEKYGADYSYDNFAPEFNRRIQNWNPETWAETFEQAGARYAVLVTKHHDGFLLWPSRNPNPRKNHWQTDRDIVGELTEAVRSKGMRMGYYYSGALDWSFNEKPIIDFADFVVNGPVEQEYIDYVDAHYRELIEKYEPSILWNDIGYPPGTNLNELFAYYYNKVPDGLVNDRWLQIPKKGRLLYTAWPIRNILGWMMKRSAVKQGLTPPKPPHSDYATPEYTTLAKISDRKWECVRGIGKSFGYNRMETPDDYLTITELVRILVDIVSKNGNLLLNMGPMADGTLPKAQVERVMGLGRWLKTNGEAIYESNPWIRAEGKTECGIDIRFTQKKDRIYAILLDTPRKPAIVIKDFRPPSRVKISFLGFRDSLAWTQQGENLRIILPTEIPPQPAHTLMISSVQPDSR
jgi:alpha-L-fucosidase